MAVLVVRDLNQHVALAGEIIIRKVADLGKTWEPE
jgi:hypothetical protein